MVPRKQILKAVRPFVGKNIVKVITGLRRSGKSVLMGQLRDMIQSDIDPNASFFYLDLDDEANADCLEKGVLYADRESPGEGSRFRLRKRWRTALCASRLPHADGGDAQQGVRGAELRAGPVPEDGSQHGQGGFFRRGDRPPVSARFPSPPVRHPGELSTSIGGTTMVHLIADLMDR